jgi:hypothetical protein
VLPLRLKDGREIPVLPMICLDDMDAGLAIEGARLGAQAILTLSNDAWFTRALGCRRIGRPLPRTKSGRPTWSCCHRQRASLPRYCGPSRARRCCGWPP